MFSRRLSLLIFAGFLALVFFMNWTYVFCSDDCGYGIMWDGKNWQHVGTIWNAFCLESVDIHRPFIHFISRIFCGCYPKWVFNICNTAVMGLLILLVNRVALRSWRPDWKAMAVMCALTFLVLCKGESYLWGCGSINYLWTGAMTLAFCLIRERLEADALSARATWTLLIPAALIGSANEAFSPPVCFGLAVTSLVNWRRLNWKKLLIYGAYGAAAVALCLIEAHRRASAVPAPSLMTVVGSVAKVVMTCKCVWILVLLFLLTPDKGDFIRRNAFELIVVFSSVIIGVAIGFVGERILWIANLMSIVVIVRSFRIGRFWALAGLAALLVTAGFVVPLGVRMRRNFDRFVADYSASADGMARLDLVPCGIWDRFFFQVCYQWQAMGYHPHMFSRYYGKPEVYPLALTSQLYDKVYLTDGFRSDFTKLPLPFEAYEVPGGNTVIIPIGKGGEFDRPFNEVSVSYVPAASAFDRMANMLTGMNRPILPFPDFPVRFKAKWGECWLVARSPSPRMKISGIRLKTTARRHPDDGMWWCAEPMKAALLPWYMK